jgi:hypothetical protein
MLRTVGLTPFGELCLFLFVCIENSRTWARVSFGRCHGPTLHPKPVPSCHGKQGSLTAFSQTDRTAPDSGGQPGLRTDPDLRLRILAHWTDARH